MSASENPEGFIAFVCPSCHQEIEASHDLAGQASECPACGEKLVVPFESQILAPSPAAEGPGPTEAQLHAMKSRTIRIELDAL